MIQACKWCKRAIDPETRDDPAYAGYCRPCEANRQGTLRTIQGAVYADARRTHPYPWEEERPAGGGACPRTPEDCGVAEYDDPCIERNCPGCGKLECLGSWGPAHHPRWELDEEGPPEMSCADCGARWRDTLKARAAAKAPGGGHERHQL